MTLTSEYEKPSTPSVIKQAWTTVAPALKQLPHRRAISSPAVGCTQAAAAPENIYVDFVLSFIIQHSSKTTKTLFCFMR